MQPPRENWCLRELRRFTDSVLERPWRFVVPQLLLFVACLIYAGFNLKFSASRTDLVSENIKYQREFMEFKREFQLPDVMVAVAESDSPEKNRLFIERLAERIHAEPKLFANTYYKGDLSQMGRKGLMFLSQDSLEEVSQVCREDWSFIENFSAANNLNSALRSLNREFREGSPSAQNSQDLADAVPAMRVFRRTIDQAVRAINQPLTNTYAGIPVLLDNQSRLYLSFGQGRIYALITHAVGPALEEKAVKRLWEIVHETRREITGVNASITGEPVLNHDELKQVTHDINLATTISFLLCALVFIIGFHEISRPLLATFCLLVGIVFALGFTTLTVGRLNILSITLVPILVGVAIDFGVHFISRYEEELCRGHTQRDALRRAFAFTGLGIITSGLTIAGAFFAMMLTDFRGIQEMGFLAGAGLLLCLLPMLTLLPLLLSRCDRVRKPTPPRRRTPPAWIESIWLNRPRLVLALAGTFTLFCLAQFPKVHFDYNLLNLQSRELPAVQTEQKLIAASSQSVLFGVVLADSLEQAVELQRKLEKLPPVEGVTSMVNYLTGDQTAKLNRVREIKKRIQSLKLPPLDTRIVDLPVLNETLYALQGYLGWAQYFADGPKADEALYEISALRSSVVRLRTIVSKGDPDTAIKLTGFQNSILGSLRETLDQLGSQDVAVGLQLDDLPKFLRERFISPNGKYLLQVHPRADVWQRQNQEEFISAIRTVAPNVTGTVVQIHEYTKLLKENFLNATFYSAGIIAVILLLQFRRLRSMFLAFLPVALGLCWTIGLMGLFKVSFNPVNIMALTLLTGIGVANGIHILIRFAQDARPTILSKSTGKAVLVSAFTTMAGFGSLMIAKHEGIASLGFVMALGTGLCLVASLAVLPALLILTNRQTAPLKAKMEATPVSILGEAAAFHESLPRRNRRPVSAYSLN
jgi:uncharacterized protein